jgi:exodeoxyribonuclease VII small subunit
MSEKKSFEESLRSLETAVERLESGELSLEEALVCYETGVKSATLCRKRLQSVETKVQLLLRERGGALRIEAADEL